MRKLKSRRDLSRWLGALAIFALTGLVFAQVIRCEFLNYDDDIYVYGNSLIARGLTFSGIAGAFAQPHARNWHPLTTLSHMLDCQLFGLQAGGHHAVNLALHALAAAGLFLVLGRMTQRFWPALFVAALFAIHPLRAESVAWVAERKDVLSAVFFVLTLGAYVRYVRTSEWQKLWPVILLYAAGLMSKPMLVTVPLILLLLDYWPLMRLRRPETRQSEFAVVDLRRAILEKIPLMAMSVLSAITTIVVANRGVPGVEGAPLLDRIANAALSYCVYFRQLFWPVNLSVFYPLPASAPALTWVCAAVIGLGAMTVLAFALRRKVPYLFVGWFWYLIMLIPVSGLLPIGLQAHADRYTYLPQIGLLIVIVWAFAGLAAKTSISAVAIPVGCVVLALLGFRTWNELRWWRTSENLWTHALAVTQDNDVALNNLGAVYEAQGQLELAAEKYREAERLLQHRPSERYRLSRALVHNNLGNVAIRQGDVSVAMDEYRQAIALQSDFANAHMNLGQAYVSLEDWNSALGEFQRAAALQPRDAEARHRAGIALMHLHRADEAIEQYESALAVDPQFAMAELDLGNALLEKKQIDDAISHYRRAIQIEPENASAHFNLAGVFLMQRRVSDAIEEYEQAVRIQPDDAESHLNLANALAAASQEKRAVAEVEKALQLAPDSVSALNNLSWLLATAKDINIRDPNRAVTLAEKAVGLAPQPNALIYHTLAAAYASLGKTSDAISAAERCKELAEENGDSALATAVNGEIDSYRRSLSR